MLLLAAQLEAARGVLVAGFALGDRRTHSSGHCLSLKSLTENSAMKPIRLFRKLLPRKTFRGEATMRWQFRDACYEQIATVLVNDGVGVGFGVDARANSVGGGIGGGA